MRIVVIGATGHVGSYLIPRLVRAGHDVVAASRGTREPYHRDPAWASCAQVVLDRKATDAEGTTADRVLAYRPDVVIDMVCFTPGSAAQLIDGLRGHVSLLAHCGTVWTHGLSTSLPIEEDDPKFPFGDYGVGKHAIEQLLAVEAEADGLASTVIHPGHISGPGWPVINPVGNLDPQVWATIAAGEELAVPGDASATLHHVHADDVAQLFERAVAQPEHSVGQSFHAVSARALTVRGYAEGAYAWWHQQPALRSLSWDGFNAQTAAEHADASWQHLHRSQVCSIAKGTTRLGYAPAWTSLAAAREAVSWLATHDADHAFPAPVA